jgi:phage/plasmid-associated DNA primase
MIGDPCEECLDFFYGEGGNGKGTFLKILQFVFGSYATTAATETFLESKYTIIQRVKRNWPAHDWFLLWK